MATKISVDGNSRVWDKNQVLVLLSRVQTLSRLMSVGSLEGNLRAITMVLLKLDYLEEHLDTVLNKCNKLSDQIGSFLLSFLKMFDVKDYHQFAAFMYIQLCRRKVMKL